MEKFVGNGGKKQKTKVGGARVGIRNWGLGFRVYGAGFRSQRRQKHEATFFFK